MTENAEATRMSTPPNGQPPTNHPASPAATAHSTHQGHEGTFVRPSDLLRPRTVSRPKAPPKPERPIDRDERAGLVGETSDPTMVDGTDWWIESHSRFPQSAQLLRSVAPELQAH
jgi:hypothetical protein